MKWIIIAGGGGKGEILLFKYKLTFAANSVIDTIESKS